MNTIVAILLFFFGGILNLYGNQTTDDNCLEGSSYNRDETLERYSDDGMRRVVLKKNTNFASQFTRSNTIYVIKYVFDLNDCKGENPVVIPASSALKFEGGSVKNGVLVGQDTYIIADDSDIFSDKIILKGTWNATEAFSEWFGARGDGLTDDTAALQSAINSFSTIKLNSRTYLCNNEIEVGDNKILIGEDCVLKCSEEGHSQLIVNGNNTLIKGITFDNIAKGYPDYGYDNGGKNSTNLVYNHSIDGIKIEGCTFKNAICGVYIHSACKNIVINNCKFDGFRSLPDNHLEPMRSCAGGYGICLDADNSDGKDIDNIYKVKISNCTFENVQRHCLYIQCVYGCVVENCFFYANRNIIHPTPFDAVIMVKNSVDLKVVKNEFYDGLEAIHLVKVGDLPYNHNELKGITVENNCFQNCGDDRGANGVIGAGYGDNIEVLNNKFYELRGKMGAIIGLYQNNGVTIMINTCVVSPKCALIATIIRYNGPDIKNVKIIGNMVDFSKTGKSYDKLIYTDFAADSLVVEDNVTIDGHSDFLISAPNVKNKKISNNRNTISAKEEGRLIQEDVMNLALFMPIGLLLGCSFRNMLWWKVLMVGCCLSAVIETIQFLTKRDFLGVNDVMLNITGCMIGYGIYSLIRLMYEKLSKRTLRFL